MRSSNPASGGGGAPGHQGGEAGGRPGLAAVRGAQIGGQAAASVAAREPGDEAAPGAQGRDPAGPERGHAAVDEDAVVEALPRQGEPVRNT